MRKKSIRKLAQLHGFWVAKTFLARTSGFSEDERQAWIRDRLGQTLSRAYEGTRYYREAFDSVGFDPRSDYRSPEDLARLPVLTKEIVKSRFADLVDERYARFSAVAETSGTTGQPLRMLLNESYIALDYACMYRMWEQAGYRFRDPFLALRSYVPSREGEPLWTWDRAQNTLFMSAYHLSPRNVGEYLKRIQSFGPRFIRSYPSSLVVLAEHLRRQGVRLEGVQGLFTASETLTPDERGIIEEVFGRKLFDWYGMTEPTLVAFEGPEHDGLNIVWQYGYPEFVPDSSLAEGDSRLIATSLHNPAMPFIRYDTGDIVTPHPTDTGSHYARKLARVQGRKDDVIVTPDGRRLPSVNFYSVFRDAGEVLRFQIVQYGSAEIVVNIETAAPGLEGSEQYRKLKGELRSRFGGEVAIEYRLNRRFETSADGKTPVVVRRLANKAVEERREYTLSSQTAWTRARAGEDVLKLDWNEADRLPSPAVREKLRALMEDPRSVFWYPEADPAALREALASYCGAPENSVLATHGSDMALSYLVQCYLNDGDRALVVSPTYDNFRALAEQRGAAVISLPFLGAGEFPFAEVIDRIESDTPRLIYLTNPNNPIGYLLPPDMIGRICAAAAKVSALVVVDEAYFEFARETCAGLIGSHSNLAICRTFSKAFGLAGLRIGYVIACPAVIGTLRRVANPKHLTSQAQVAAVAALEDRAGLDAYVEEVIRNRARFQAFLEARGIPCHPSRGNYVLFRCDDPAGLIQWCEERNVLLRDRTAYFGGAGHVRASIGGDASTTRLIEVLTAYWEQTKPRV